MLRFCFQGQSQKAMSQRGDADAADQAPEQLQPRSCQHPTPVRGPAHCLPELTSYGKMLHARKETCNHLSGSHCPLWRKGVRHDTHHARQLIYAASHPHVLWSTAARFWDPLLPDKDSIPLFLDWSPAHAPGNPLCLSAEHQQCGWPQHAWDIRLLIQSVTQQKDWQAVAQQTGPAVMRYSFLNKDRAKSWMHLGEHLTCQTRLSQSLLLCQHLTGQISLSQSLLVCQHLNPPMPHLTGHEALHAGAETTQVSPDRPLATQASPEGRGDAFATHVVSPDRP